MYFCEERLSRYIKLGIAEDDAWNSVKIFAEQAKVNREAFSQIYCELKNRVKANMMSDLAYAIQALDNELVGLKMSGLASDEEIEAKLKSFNLKQIE